MSKELKLKTVVYTRGLGTGFISKLDPQRKNDCTVEITFPALGIAVWVAEGAFSLKPLPVPSGKAASGSPSKPGHGFPAASARQDERAVKKLTSKPTMTTSQVRRLLAIKGPQVRVLCKAGQFKGHQAAGGKWEYDTQSVLQYKEKRP